MTLSASVGSILHAAVDEIVGAAAHPDRLDRVGLVLREITHRLHALGHLIHEADDDEVLLHASDALTIYHITLTPGLEYPPRNHLMDALVGIYRGGETNFIYPESDGRLQAADRRDVVAPVVIHMPPATVHSVANSGIARSGALHVYLGDLLKSRRQMWRFAGDQPLDFDNDRYLAGARRIEP